MARRNSRRIPSTHALFEPLESRQLMSSITWDGGGDGTTLNQATNWTGDVLPGAADDAVINVAGTPTISMTAGAFSVNSLTCAETFNLAGGTLTVAAPSALSGPFAMTAGTLNGAGALTISSTFNWSGGSMAGSGTTTLSAASTSTFSGSSTIGINRNMTNAGAITWTGANLGGFPGSGVTFTNSGSFTANLANNFSLAANTTPNTFVNTGTFTKSGVGVLSVDGFAFNSSGSVNISAGTLKFMAGGTVSGAMTVAAGATLIHSTGAFSYAAGASLAGTGAWSFTNGTTSFDIPFTPAGSITASGGVLTLNATQSVAAITLSGGVINGTGNLTITGTLTWSQGGFSGSGLITLAASGTANLGSGSMALSENFTNAGTVNWTNGTIGGWPGSGITFTNNGTFNAAVTADNFFYGNTTPSTFLNHGTLHKTGANVVTFATCGLVNTGSVLIDGGSIVMANGGGLGGTFTIAAGAFLDMGGGAFSDAACTLSGAGTARFLGGTHTLNGTLTLNSLASLNNTTIGGAGDMSLNALFDWQSGTIGGTGTTTINPGITLQMATYATKNLGRTLVNNGRVEHSLGYLQLTGNATLQNNAGHTYNMTQTGDLYMIGSNNLVTNAGTFNSDTSSDPVVTCTFNNSGTLNIFQGTFDIDAGGTNSGPRNIAAGAQLRYHASYTHAAGSTTGGSGLFILNGGTHTISGDWTIGCFSQLLTGILTGAGNLTTNGPLSWGAGSMTGPGSLIIGAPGKLAIVTYSDHVLGRNIVNHGQLQYLNGGLHLTGTTITNGGTFAILSLSPMTLAVTGGVNAINNSGLMRKMGSAYATLDSALGGITLSNTGTIDVRNGTLNVNGPLTQLSANTLSAGTWQVYPTGAINLLSPVHTIGAGATVNLVGGNAAFPALSTLTTNNGALNLSLGGIFQTTPTSGTFTNNGSITLTQDRWLVVYGAFAQGSSGSVSMSLLSPTRYSRIVTSAGETLGGSVSFNFVNSYTPAAGTTFDFFHSSGRTGQFAHSTIPSIPGHGASIVYNPTGAQLVVS